MHHRRRALARGAGLAAAAILGIGALLAGSPLAGAAHPDRPGPDPAPSVTSAERDQHPFESWNPEVTASADDPHTLQLAYDSPRLRQRTVSTVYLPDGYRDSGAPWPVLYSLHGTVLPQTAGAPPLLADQTPDSLAMSATGGGQQQTETSDFAAQRKRAHYVVVAPDTTAGTPWCQTCAWIDGRDDLLPNVAPVTAATVPADAVLHDEILPLVEASFHVRTDRAGRGVTGFSMGGWGALLQGLKHPDRFAFVASVSGVYDVFSDPVGRYGVLEPAGYLRDQGYGTSLTNPVWWKNFSPAALLDNIRGIPTTLILSSGDACLRHIPSDNPTCDRQPAYSDPALTYIEIAAARQLDIARHDLPAHEIPARTVRRPGIHGANNAEVYAAVIVPSANHAFADPGAEPESFTYTAAEPSYSVWGYQVRRHDDDPAPAFLTLTDATRDGHDFSLSGTGRTTVTIPPTLLPGTEYTATISSEQHPENTRTVTSDEQGRIALPVELGPDPTTVHVHLTRR